MSITSDILYTFIKVVVGIISYILRPIDNLILAYLPDLSNAFTAIGNMLQLASSSLGWVISLTGLSATALSLIVTYFTFKLTVPILVYFIKLAIKWYDKLKP